MTNSLLTLERVSLVLPNGTPLFTDITEQFDHRHTGLVGRNGVGKSLLAQLLAGLLAPTSGQCHCSGKVRYLAQHLTPEKYPHVAALAGVEARAQLSQQVQEAAKDIETATHIVMHSGSLAGAHPQKVAALTDVILPFVAPPFSQINLAMSGGQRIGVVGPNGCGKSTLLKVLAGLLPPVSGLREAWVKMAYLDQRLSSLDPHRTALEQLLEVNSVAGESQLRMQLAQLGLDAGRALLPCAQLSGGEQLKAALAKVIYASSPADCLLLDEPSNHLDLPSLAALEALLNEYQGTLLVVSHDEAFLAQIGLSHWLVAGEEGWELIHHQNSV